MNFKQFTEAVEELPQTLYHATFNELIPSIKHVGIGGSYLLKNFEGVEDGVYLADNSDRAGEFVEATENETIPNEWFDQIVICKVDTSKLDKSKFFIDPNLSLNFSDVWPDYPEEIWHSYLYKGVVPYSAILDITDYK